MEVTMPGKKIVLANPADFLALYNSVQTELENGGTLDGLFLTDRDGEGYFYPSVLTDEERAKDKLIENFPLKEAFSNETLCQVLRNGRLYDERQREEALAPFQCVILHDTALSPALTLAGTGGGQAALTEWFESHSTDPKTRQNFSNNRLLVPNHALLDLLRLYLNCDLGFKKELKKEYSDLRSSRDELAVAALYQTRDVRAMKRWGTVAFMVSFFSLISTYYLLTNLIFNHSDTKDIRSFVPLDFVKMGLLLFLSIAMCCGFRHGNRMCDRSSTAGDDGAAERAFRDAEGMLSEFQGGLFGPAEVAISIPVELPDHAEGEHEVLLGDSVRYGAIAEGDGGFDTVPLYSGLD